MRRGGSSRRGSIFPLCCDAGRPAAIMTPVQLDDGARGVAGEWDQALKRTDQAIGSLRISISNYAAPLQWPSDTFWQRGA